MHCVMRNVYLRMFRILFFSDLHATRFTLGLAELIWAITLAWPGDTFDRPTYTAMARVMHEEAWALVFLLSGVTQWVILATGRYHERFPMLFAAWNTCLWWFACITMYMSVYPPPAAISGELALAIASLWVFVRTGYQITGKRAGDLHD